MRPLGWLLVVGSAVGCTSSGVDGGRKDKPCGVDGGSAFRVEVRNAFIFPYKPETEEPWDWDGDIPDWLIDLTNQIGEIAASPQLLTAAEIMEVVDEVAPLILEGTTPPDPILEVVAALDEAVTTTTSTLFGGTTYTWTYASYPFGEMDTYDDTYEPRFDQVVEIDLFPDETLWLDVTDEDLALHDYVGSVGLKLRDLRALARCGPTTLRAPSNSGLYSVGLVVEPL
jgi:hypothetical protein